ncbi:MAG: hypothetical protein N3A38_11215, partial [Planctomycetota bacterium]|nr:hypothetical protein [Planctomycetota bacterium]
MSVAAVGIGAVCAAGAGVGALSRALLANSDCLRPRGGLPGGDGPDGFPVGSVPETVWEEMRRGAGRFRDAAAFVLADWAAGEAAASAREALRGIPAARVGLVLATTKAEAPAIEKAADGIRCAEIARRHILPFELARDLADRHCAKAGARCVSAGCVSGLLAIRLAARALLRGEWDAALVVGTDCLSAFTISGFAALKALAPDGCRPFDRDRKGLSPGEAGAAIVLIRAREARVPPLALITGWGASNDANHITGPSRDGSGLAAAIRRALPVANVSPGSVDFVHAHGTGTPYNDAMESLALRAIFGAAIPPVASSKGMLGHTFGAAGVLETVVSILAIIEGFLPGTPRLVAPDPAAPAGLLKDPVPGRRPARILKTMTGFGGMNAALVIEAPGHCASDGGAGPRAPRAAAAPAGMVAGSAAMILPGGWAGRGGGLRPWAGPAAGGDAHPSAPPEGAGAVPEAGMFAVEGGCGGKGRHDGKEGGGAGREKRPDVPAGGGAGGAGRGGGWFPPFQWRELSGSAFPRFGRLDPLCKVAVSAVELLGADFAGMSAESKARTAVFLGTSAGCVTTDVAYWRSRKEPGGPSPALFTYTLPSMAIGEICIRFRLTGPDMCLMLDGTDDRPLLAEAADCLESGEADRCLCVV